MTFPPFYAGYVGRIPDNKEPDGALHESAEQLLAYLTAVSAGHASYAYAPGKWTVRQATQHIIDTERIFAYRVLRLGRRDPTPLPGFEQNDFADRAPATHRPLPELVGEFRTLRLSTRQLVASLSEEDLDFVGTVSGGRMSCRAMAYVAAGHCYHHVAVFRERYGTG